jgi:hypothetical protein
MPKNSTSFVAFVAQTLTVHQYASGFSLLGASLNEVFIHTL